MIQISKFDWRPWLDMFFRRKWWVLIPFVLTLAGGVVFIEWTPKVYKASTMILVESQRVPTEYVPSPVPDDLQQRLQTISQQVRSRTNLENIIERHELFPGPEDVSLGILSRVKREVLSRLNLLEASVHQIDEERPSMQQLVNDVRSRIDVSLRANNQAFEISFQWSDPHVAARVANALASQFIDQNLKVREQMAIGTSRFLDAEVQRLQSELRKREVALEDFKHRNMGSLPSQLQSNLNILSQLKEELSRTEDQIIMIRQEIQFLDRYALLQAQALPAGAQFTETGARNREAELASLQNRLQELLGRYTEQHPDVQALQRRIEQAQKEAEQEQPALSADESPPVSPREVMDPNIEQLQIRLARNERRVLELNSQISAYQQRVEQTTEVELELTNLERDYNAVNDRFQILFRRKLDAELAEQMEKSQQGEQFRVIDPAISPDRPFKPDIGRVILLTLALGLGMGGGMAFLRESIDPAFYNAEEVEHFLKPELLISLPLVRELKKSGKKSTWRHS
jgi:polysaccharide chain length determinant protein (PEP-CTERM system associated)